MNGRSFYHGYFAGSFLIVAPPLSPSPFLPPCPLQDHGSRAFYRSPSGPPAPRSPISSVPSRYPECGDPAVAGDALGPQPGVGQRALHEPAATTRARPPDSGASLPAGGAPGKVSHQSPAAAVIVDDPDESPWRRRSNLEPLVMEPPPDLDDAELPVSQV